MPQVQAAQNSGSSWFPVFLHVTFAGLFAISSYWAAITLGWTLFTTGTELEGDNRSNFRALCLTSLAGMALPALGLVWLGGWLALGVAAGAVLLPIAGYAPAVLQRVKLPPMYSRAIAKIKFGKYTEAEWEIIRQLEHAENDFNGWLMLAELQANQFKDLAEAEQIILEMCNQPSVTPSQVSIALHKLADWHLNLGGDPEAARRALEVIAHRLPGTHLAHMARARSAQLPRTAEEWREQHTATAIPMPALGESMDEPEKAIPAVSAADAAQAAVLANQLTERLARNPDDAPARERLARTFAEQLGKADSAIEQLEFLLGLVGPPDNKRAEWLGLIAAWQLKFKHDPAAARQTLERLVGEFPDSPQAFAAHRRLRLLDRAPGNAT
jgi:TolA-binding protein